MGQTGIWEAKYKLIESEVPLHPFARNSFPSTSKAKPDFHYLRIVLSLDNISYDIGGRFLFKDASLQIRPGDKIGLVGRNGTGKTTLLRLIAHGGQGLTGTVGMPKNLKIGFLDQELQSYQTEKSVFGVAMEAFEDLLKLKDDIQQLIHDLEHRHDETMVKRLSDMQHAFEDRGGYEMEARAHSILGGLGFAGTDHDMPFRTFSGGWRMRVILAKLLLQEPDLLLLDEPTNHLDLPSIAFVEDYLRAFKGAFVLVSHDRFFMDRLAETIVDLAGAKFTRYSGNYSFYLVEREQRRDLQQRQFENQAKMIADTEKFINRFRAKATKAKQVQSRVKMLDKIDRVEAPDSEDAVMHMSFKPNVQPGRQILQLKIQGKAYGDKKILEAADVTIFRGDKIALIGANGIGKSTVLRMVAGTEPFEGEKVDGHNVHESFFAQHQLEALTPANTILEEMVKFVREKGEGFVRNVLGGFLFSGEDVDKKILVLSGGEKSRVALAKTLLSEANFLLLDEPTNHLDIQSIQILIQALQQYEGTYICVSHDRYFLGEIANKIWYIDNKVLKEFPGTYAEYEYHIQNKNAIAAQEKVLAKEALKQDSAAEKKGKEAYEEEKRKKARLKKIDKEVEDAETTLMEMEAKKSALMASMADPENATQFDKLAALQKEYNAWQAKSDKQTELWEALVEEQDALKAEFDAG